VRRTTRFDGRTDRRTIDSKELTLGGFLEGEDGSGLEAEVVLEVLGDLADEALEGGLPDEELRGFLTVFKRRR